MQSILVYPPSIDKTQQKWYHIVSKGVFILTKKLISYLFDGILAGFMIGIGAIVFMSSDNRYIGAFLFSLGLFSVVCFKYGLFTGKVGYIVNREKAYLIEVGITLIANLIGTFAAAFLFRASRFKTALVSGLDVSACDRAKACMLAKINDSLLSSFVLAVFCGLLMFTAYRKCKEENNFSGAVFGVVFPVVVFIICGFNHCIADMAYYFMAGCPDVAKALPYFIVVILGNSVGGMIVPLFKKLSVNPL